MSVLVNLQVSKPLSLPEPYVRSFEKEKEVANDEYVRKTNRYLDSVHKLQVRWESASFCLVIRCRIPPRLLT